MTLLVAVERHHTATASPLTSTPTCGPNEEPGPALSVVGVENVKGGVPANATGTKPRSVNSVASAMTGRRNARAVSPLCTRVTPGRTFTRAIRNIRRSSCARVTRSEVAAAPTTALPSSALEEPMKRAHPGATLIFRVRSAREPAGRGRGARRLLRLSGPGGVVANAQGCSHGRADASRGQRRASSSAIRLRPACAPVRLPLAPTARVTRSTTACPITPTGTRPSWAWRPTPAAMTHRSLTGCAARRPDHHRARAGAWRVDVPVRVDSSKPHSMLMVPPSKMLAMV